jgi:hypothetical protein
MMHAPLGVLPALDWSATLAVPPMSAQSAAMVTDAVPCAQRKGVHNTVMGLNALSRAMETAAESNALASAVALCAKIKTVQRTALAMDAHTTAPVRTIHL